MIDKLTEEQLAMMTEAEREGYQELLEEDFGDEGDTGTDLGEGDGDNGDGDNGGGDPDADFEGVDGQEQGADGKPLAGAGSEVDQPDNSAEEEVTDTQVKPDVVIPSLDEVQGKLKSLSEQKDTLSDQFDDGDLTAKEYRQKVKELDDQEWALRKQELEIDNQIKFAENEQKKAVDQFLQRDVPAFFKQHPQYAGKDTPGNLALDNEVRRLQAQKFTVAEKLNPDILVQAHNNLRAAFGLPADDTLKDPAKPTRAAKPARELPPTLASIPASDIADTNNDDGGAGAYLDRLLAKGTLEHEAALAKLSPEQRDRYLQRG